MTEEKVVFKLPQEDLENPKYRKGYPGRLHTVYARSWDKEAVEPHPLFNAGLASYYKAGRMVGLRNELMSILNNTIGKNKKNENK